MRFYLIPSFRESTATHDAILTPQLNQRPLKEKTNESWLLASFSFAHAFYHKCFNLTLIHSNFLKALYCNHFYAESWGYGVALEKTHQPWSISNVGTDRGVTQRNASRRHSSLVPTSRSLGLRIRNGLCLILIRCCTHRERVVRAVRLWSKLIMRSSFHSNYTSISQFTMFTFTQCSLHGLHFSSCLRIEVSKIRIPEGIEHPFLAAIFGWLRFPGTPKYWKYFVKINVAGGGKIKCVSFVIAHIETKLTL